MDEVGELSAAAQPKLLRALENRQIKPVGHSRYKSVDVRIIAATNQILEDLVREKRFREDLFYRLNVMRLELPPLKERRGDIPLLISNFVKQYNITKGSAVSRIAEDAMDILLNYHYPGNIRELENIIEHAGVLCQGELIERRHLPMYIQEITGQMGVDTVTRAEVTAMRDQRERELLVEVLKKHRWHRQKAAQALGMDRTTLWRKMKKYDISP